MGVLSGKVVVILGASSGIGAGCAVEVARAGGKLVLAARRMEKLEVVAGECRKVRGSGARRGGDEGASVPATSMLRGPSVSMAHGAGESAVAGDVVVVGCDVAKRGDVEGAIRRGVEVFGRVDVVVANAGYGVLARVHEMEEGAFDEMVATNVKGTWYAMQAAAGVMLKQAPDARGRRGHIIAVSSGAARRGLPLYGVYAMTKAAQLSLAEAMRVEMKGMKGGEGIYVSTVHPLTTATEFFEVASSKSRFRSSGLGHAQPVGVVARKMVGLMRRPKPELWPVWGSRWMLVLAAAMPRVGDWAMGRTVGRRSR